jgi:hypothetical protein
VDFNGVPIGDGNSSAFLPTMLQSEQTKVCDSGYIVARSENTENPTLFGQPFAQKLIFAHGSQRLQTSAKRRVRSAFSPNSNGSIASALLASIVFFT